MWHALSIAKGVGIARDREFDSSRPPLSLWVCNSDYLAPSRREQELQRAARLLVYDCKALGKKPEKWTVAEAGNIYAKDERSVTELCAELKKMDKAAI